MANKQINIRLPKKLLEEGHEIVKDFNYRNIQHLIIEALREAILEHKTKREVEAIKQFQEMQGMDLHQPRITMKDLAKKFGRSFK